MAHPQLVGSGRQYRRGELAAGAGNHFTDEACLLIGQGDFRASHASGGGILDDARDSAGSQLTLRERQNQSEREGADEKSKPHVGASFAEKNPRYYHRSLTTA